MGINIFQENMKMSFYNKYISLANNIRGFSGNRLFASEDE
jgi:hypothetical protein